MNITIKILSEEHLEQAITLRSFVFEQREVMNSWLNITAQDNAKMSELTMPSILKQGLSVGAFDGEDMIGILLCKRFSLIDESIVKDVPESFVPIVYTMVALHQEYRKSLEERIENGDSQAEKILKSLSSDDVDTKPILFSTAAVKKGYEGQGLAQSMSYAASLLIMAKAPNTVCHLTEATGERSQALAKKNGLTPQGLVVYEDVQVQGRNPFQGIPNFSDGSQAKVIMYETNCDFMKLVAIYVLGKNWLMNDKGFYGIPFDEYDDLVSALSIGSFVACTGRMLRYGLIGW